MKVTKITPAQLQELIREQAVKYKKVLELEARKEAIVKQLNEMYGPGEVHAGSMPDLAEMDNFGAQPDVSESGMEEEGFLGFGQTPEEKAKAMQAKGMQVIQGNRNFQAMYAGFQKSNPQQAEKMIQYLAAHPDAKGIKWNPARNEFADINDNITGNLLQRMGTGAGVASGGGRTGAPATE